MASAAAAASTTRRKTFFQQQGTNMHGSFFLGPQYLSDKDNPSAPPETDISNTQPRPPPYAPQDKTQDFKIEGMTDPKQTTKDEGNAVESETQAQSSWWSLSTRKIYILNSIAVLVHGALLVGTMILANQKSPKIWHLKHDRIHASPAFSPVKTNNIITNNTSTNITDVFMNMLMATAAQQQQQFVQVADQSCSPAKPNMLNFSSNSATGNSSGPLVMWAYPQVYPPLIVFCF